MAKERDITEIVNARPQRKSKDRLRRGDRDGERWKEKTAKEGFIVRFRASEGKK